MTWVTHNYPRVPGDLPGGFLHPLAAALVRLGHEMTVVAPSDAGQGGDETRDGVRIRRVRYASPSRERYAYHGTMLSALRSPGGLLALAGLLRALRRSAREAGGQVIHAHWWVPGGVAAPSGTPLVVTLHGTDARLLERSAVARALGRRVLGRSGLVTTVSHAVADTVSRTMGGRKAQRTEVQPMPVDTTGWGWTRGGGGALVVARLTAQKRVDLALRAVAELATRGRRVPCTVVGDGPERPALESAARALGIADLVEFTGALPFPQVLERLYRADVAIQPSFREGFGLAAAEALMTGVPVVACPDGGGLLDVVSPSGAGRVAEPDPSALSTAVLALLDDPAAREAARVAGAEWRERLEPAAVAARFAGWYEEVAGA